MTKVVMLPKAAADAVCHDAQMIIWSGNVVTALQDGGFLRNDLVYDDVVLLHKSVASEIRKIVRTAFDHPSVKSFKQD